MEKITTIAFDADDTLWDNTVHYNITERSFVALLEEYSQFTDLGQRLHDTEIRNLAYYGFGVKGFTLSMIETAIEVTQQRVPVPILRQILMLGRKLHDHPIETYPHVQDVVTMLGRSYRTMLITKGDLMDQERKISQSGMAEDFDHVEIVSDKIPEVYDRIFCNYADGPARSVMVGNSIRSDILPALDSGAWAVLIPCADDWEYEKSDLPVGHPRFRQIDSMTHLPETLQEIDRLQTDDCGKEVSASAARQ